MDHGNKIFEFFKYLFIQELPDDVHKVNTTFTQLLIQKYVIIKPSTWIHPKLYKLL